MHRAEERTKSSRWSAGRRSAAAAAFTVRMANISSLIHDLRERIAASASVAASSSNCEDPVETKFRAVLPNLLHAYVVPSSTETQHMILVWVLASICYILLVQIRLLNLQLVRLLMLSLDPYVAQRAVNFSAYVRIAKSCHPQIWESRLPVRMLCLERPCLPLIQCVRAAITILIPGDDDGDDDDDIE